MQLKVQWLDVCVYYKTITEISKLIHFSESSREKRIRMLFMKWNEGESFSHYVALSPLSLIGKSNWDVICRRFLHFHRKITKARTGARIPALFQSFRTHLWLLKNKLSLENQSFGLVDTTCFTVHLIFWSNFLKSLNRNMTEEMWSYHFKWRRRSILIHNYLKHTQNFTGEE